MPGRSTAGHFALAGAFASCDPQHPPADARAQIDRLADDTDSRDGRASTATHTPRTRHAHPTRDGMLSTITIRDGVACGSDRAA
jgi:hypothetical protein